MGLRIVDNAKMCKFTQDQLMFQCRVIKMRLWLASGAIVEGRADDAERIYKQALEQAEVVAGEKSALVGLVALELFDLYEWQGRTKQAGMLWARIREIMSEHS